MKKIIKNIIAGVTVASLVFSSATAVIAKDPFLIYQQEDSETISSGLNHQHIQKFTSEGWLNLNVLRVNLDDEYTKIKPIFNSTGVSSRDQVSDMVKNSGAIAGVNGDFFYTEKKSSPFGATVVDGEMITSPGPSRLNMPVMSIDENNIPTIRYWDFNITAYSENGQPTPVYSINKSSSQYGEIRMFDKGWGDKTLGNTLYNDMAEVIVEDGEVKDIRVGQPPVEMPEDGFILVGRDNAKNTLLNNFRIGGRVKLDMTTNPDFEKISSAIGGGTILVKDGKVAEFTNNIRGSHPRTAVGISKDNKEIIMLTIDGRHSSFNGVSQEKLAEIMIDLGATDAINLDGGGSTTMAIAPKHSEKVDVVNVPSDGSERAVINGLGVFNDAPQRSLDDISIVTEDKKVFKGTTRDFTIKGYDRYRNPVKIDIDDVDFSIDNSKGRFNGNTLIAESEGPAIVEARYKGEKAELNIEILDKVKSLDIDSGKLTLDSNKELDMIKAVGNIYGKNNDGYRAKISLKDITWKTTGNIGRFDGNMFVTSDHPSSGALTAMVGNAVKNIKVSVGFNKVDLHSLDSLTGLSIATYPSIVRGDIDTDSEDKEGRNSIKLSYDFTGTDKTRAASVMFDKKLHINNTPDKIGMWIYGENNNNWVRGEIVDKSGKSYPIDFVHNVDWEGWKWTTASIPSNVEGPITLKRVYVAEINPVVKEKGYLLFDGLKALYSPGMDGNVSLPQETNTIDERKVSSKVTEEDLSFMLVDGINSLDNLLDNIVSSKLTSEMNKHDLGLILGSMNNTFGKNINTNTLNISSNNNSVKLNNTLVMNIDDSNGGIRATNANQWLNLKNTLQNTSKQNIIITLPKAIFGNNGFNDKLEADLFHQILTEYQRSGKDIWVIHGGNKDNTTLKDGIRYIEIQNRDIKSVEDAFDYNYMLFKIQNGKLTYQRIPLFNRDK